LKRDAVSAGCDCALRASAKAVDIIGSIEIRLKEKNIAEVLDLTVEQGLDFLKIFPVFVASWKL